VLFDIDGTILRTGGAGRRTMNQIFGELWGVENAFDGITADGKTDPMIFREMLLRHEVEVEDESTAIAEIRRRYEAGFGAEMATSSAMLMPGVEPLLAALHNRNDVAVGLLTGNLEVTARIKVEHFGLGRYFPFGAFSSDHEVRRRLPPVAVQRASTWLGRSIGMGPHVAILGDTPHDIDCALANGCTAVGVAAARYSSDDLRAAGAHVTLPDLASIQGALAALGLDGTSAPF
jgi:phosphoglycolate phosphatase-like HAD superfamily hydrolase